MYVARHTYSPEYDIERNWVGWMSDAWDSEEEAMDDIVYDHPKYEEFLDRFLLRYDAETAYQKTYEAIAETVDVRFNEVYGKWQHVHHEGLSCWLLESETEAEAVAEATANASAYDWCGFGEQTIGKVRFVKRITTSLCVFECEDTKPESDF